MVVFFFSLTIANFFQSDVDSCKSSDSNDTNWRKTQTSNKKKKAKESSDDTIAIVISGLRKKHHCIEHDRPCIIQNSRHKEISFAMLNVWARSIVSDW